ncbi:hypothetical protein HAX54_002059 [Datura stramonium]|uniref:1-phosphatidylinositol 4-kinase n=1 Tax=Datura stramonium TaxID=4076 RepID=A0ABS8T3B7_DATST|nr:hypothetical protein [Datura stramonium]
MSSVGMVAISPVCVENIVIPPVHRQESILIYVAMSEFDDAPLRVLEYDSIESVKVQIQSCKGFVVKNQKLVCGGRELARRNSLIRDYGVSDGNVLHLVLRLSVFQAINVTTSSGEKFTFNVSILKIREVICDLCKNNDAVIHLFVRKNAKIRARPLDKNFELSIVAPHDNDVKEYDVVRENRSGTETDHKVLVPRKPPDREIFLEPVIVDPRIEIPVFKPIDRAYGCEQPQGAASPVSGEGLKKGTRVGEGGLRECAAYILDHPKSGRRSLSGEIKGFAGVPPAACEVEDGGVMLIPVDHGYCLPNSFEDVTFDWLYWPQARQPFSSETIEYIKSLDTENIGLLKFYGWDIPLESARTLRISTMLLKKGAERDLTPFTIGSIMCRETLNKESVIEEILQEAWTLLPGSSEGYVR